MTFVPAGKVTKRQAAGKELTAQDWKMKVHLDQNVTFSLEIITASLRLDLILWSASQKVLFIIELTVPWEDTLGEVYKCKKLMYSHLTTEADKRAGVHRCSL